MDMIKAQSFAFYILLWEQPKKYVGYNSAVKAVKYTKN